MEVSLACVAVRSAGRSVAGWWLGGAVRCGWLAGSVLWKIMQIWTIGMWIKKVKTRQKKRSLILMSRRKKN